MEYKMDIFSNLNKIELGKNTKIPCKKGWNNIKNQIKIVDTTKYNIGIPCGKHNNIICLDVDFKDDGIKEFNEYIEKFGEPNTVKQKTPSGGYHYIFNYSSSNEDDQYIIKNYLLNKTKYRNKGLDIRSEGGYFVSAPSKIDNKEYVYINNFDNTKIIDMPSSLIIWLLDGTNNDNKIINNNKSDYHISITDDEIKNILNKLDDDYYNNYSKWLIVLTALKNLDKFEIFDQFSKKSIKYNYDTNLRIWNSNNFAFLYNSSIES